MTVKLGSALTLKDTGVPLWGSSVDPVAMTEVGHDVATGRPRIYVGGAAHSVAHVDELGGSSALTLLETITVTGSAVASFTFSGLNGDVDKLYKLLWRLVVNGTCTVDIKPNNLST